MWQKILSAFMAIQVFFTLLPFATWGTGPEKAYLSVLEELIGNADSIKHISVDPENANTKDNPKLVEALRIFCKNRDKTLYMESLSELFKKGLLEEGENGFCIGGEPLAEISFREIKLTKNSFTGVVGWLRGDCWGAGYEYKVKRIGFIWVIVSKESAWVS